MKAAMKAKDKDRLSTIRLILAEFKRIEVDERIEVDDARALAVLQAKASELGGCAVTTIFREPVTLVGSDTSDGSYQRSRIIGYVYYGKIVRKR